MNAIYDSMLCYSLKLHKKSLYDIANAFHFCKWEEASLVVCATEGTKRAMTSKDVTPFFTVNRHVY